MAPDDMQTQPPAARYELPAHVQALRALSADEIERQGAAADQRLASASDAVTAAEGEAAKALAQFRSKPSAATHSATAVADQVLSNARDALAQAQSETQLVLAERARRRALGRLQELAPAADAERVLAAASERWGTLLRAVRDQLAAETRQLASELAAVRDAAAERARVQGELTLADWRLSGGEARGSFPELPQAQPPASIAGALQRVQRDHAELFSNRHAHAMSLALDNEGVALSLRARID